MLPNFSKMTDQSLSQNDNDDDLPLGTKISDFGRKVVGTSKEIFDQVKITKLHKYYLKNKNRLQMSLKQR